MFVIFPRLLFTKNADAFIKSVRIIFWFIFDLLSRVLDVSLRKNFQKRPIGNVTVCNRNLFFAFNFEFYAPVYPGAYFYYGFIFYYFIRLSNRRPA